MNQCESWQQDHRANLTDLPSMLLLSRTPKYSSLHFSSYLDMCPDSQMATPWMQSLMDSCDWLKASCFLPKSQFPSDSVRECTQGVQEEAGERTDVAMDKRLRPLHHQQALKCPRCGSAHTKFCYYNNYSLYQPRYFCKTCRRYWTRGGTLRNVPVGGGCRKNKRSGTKKTAGLLHPHGGGGAAAFHQPFPLAQPPHPSIDFTKCGYELTLDGSADRPDLMDANLGLAAFAGSDFSAGPVVGTSQGRGLSSADFPVPGNHAAAAPAELKAVNGRNILSWGWPNADNTVIIDGHGFYAI